MDPVSLRCGVFSFFRDTVMRRVQCYIDGFNLYHAIAALREDHLKWLNLRSLATAFIIPSQETLNEIFYFSAYATWRPSAQIKHREYVRALESHGVTPILGHFKKKPMSCNRCGASWDTHEEKASDVNFAIKLIEQAHYDQFDRALIITADSDLCPPIQMILDTFPQKEFVILTPPNRYEIARELRGLVPTNKIKRKHLANNLFPDKIVDSSGKILASRPADYTPPLPARP